MRLIVGVGNAIPTAEGALQYAMENSEITLHGNKCLVLGFGRCAKVLANMLRGIGAHVGVMARSNADLAYIGSYGYTPIPPSLLWEQVGQYDFIFNTVPSLILDEEILQYIKKDCLIVELASKPGGIDLQKAEKLQLKVVDGQSLPGKVAPETAGKIIFDTILNVCREMEVIL